MNALMQQIAGKHTHMHYLSRVIVTAVCAVLALASFTALSARFSSIDSYEHEIAVLDEKRASATELFIAAVGASAGITMIPDDACTPIANELAEIGKDLAIVSGVILLEKYLMTITGYAFFKALVPLCLVLFAIGYWKDAADPMRSSLLNGAIKVLIVGAIIWQAVPVSVRVIDLFDATYDETISQAIESAQQAGAIAEDDKAIEEVVTEEDQSQKGWLGTVMDAVGAAGDTIASGVSKAATAATSGASKLVAWAKVVLTQVTEGFAVLVVTSCIVPVAMPLIAYWLVKVFFQPSGASVAVLQLPPELKALAKALPEGDAATKE